jgi:hypothetical protein
MDDKPEHFNLSFRAGNQLVACFLHVKGFNGIGYNKNTNKEKNLDISRYQAAEKPPIY